MLLSGVVLIGMVSVAVSLPLLRRVAPVVLATGALSVLLSGGVKSLAHDRSTALSDALREQGLVVDPAEVRWVDAGQRSFFSLRRDVRAIVRGSPAAGEPNDIFVVDTELSPEGVLLRVRSAYNLTETPGADESVPLIQGERVAYVARPLIVKSAATIHVLDLRGQPPLSTSDWPWIERIQNAITNAQQTGRLRGIGEHTFSIESPQLGGPGEGAARDKPAAPEDAPSDVTIRIEGELLRVRAGDREAVVPIATGDSGAAPPDWVRIDPREVARPGNLVTWSVDRVRAVPWIGDETMQYIKAIAFTALDFVLRNKESMTGDTGAEEIAVELGQTELEPPVRAIPVDPEIGWPPPPIEPWVTPALPGEGQWNPQGNNPFVRQLPGLPPAFLTTFVRSDRSRKATRVFVALWDPRQVELHMMAGTVEPKGATGEAGPGLIPRTPEVMKRVVAASNSGFQALHGEFGMMADGVVYLPPKPYAATVAVLRDGSSAFGTWPEDATIPASILSYRQNMTVMVQDEKFNPYGRTWWGGTPPGWADRTHTVRTGICLTRESFVAYFYGTDIAPEALSQAMIQARCKYGIALDMNAGHSGLEFYRVAPAAELEPLGRPLQGDWEAEGTVPGLDGWKFRGRRLIRGMGLMNFPRYIRRESRDFFYMTLRHLLPGEPIAPKVQPPLSGEGEWRVKGLPQHGFPYALAMTQLRPDPSRPDVRLRVLKIDPRTVRAVPAHPRNAEPGASPSHAVATLDPGEAPSGDVASLWQSAGAFSVETKAPVDSAVRLASGHLPGAPIVAALCVNDEDGMLLYAETDPPVAPSAADTQLFEAFMKNLGCSTPLLLSRKLSIALGGDTDLSGAAVRPVSTTAAVVLERIAAPDGKRIMENTPLVPFDVWYPLQQKRIRYFKKPQGEATDGAAEDEAQ